MPKAAYADCTNLKTITISKGVKTIDDITLCNCSGLTDI